MKSSDGRHERADAEDVLRILTALLSLLYGAWMIWLMVPEHRKRLWLMRLSRAIQSSASSIASRTGAQAMREEVRSGVPNYHLPYAASRIRERAQELYETLRYTA